MTRHEIRVEQTMDEALLAAAEVELARALILQNARTATRWDPFSRHRTQESERRLLVVGRSLAVVGSALALLMVVVNQLQGRARPLHWLLLITLVLFAIVITFLPRLRAAGVVRLDAMLRRRARKLLSKALVGSHFRYTLDQSALRCETVEGDSARLRFKRSLSGVAYALAGEACLVLFARKRAQNPVAIVLARNRAIDDAARDAGIEVETLAKDLLPTTTLERWW